MGKAEGVMRMATKSIATVEDLDYLRKESLQFVLLCAVIGLYLWCAVLFFTNDRFGPVWWGPVLLAGGLAVAFAKQNRNMSLSAVAAILGVAATALHNMWLVDARVTPYVLAVVVSLAGLLFGMKAVVWATAACSGLVIAIGSMRWGHSPFSPELLSPVLVIGAIGVLSSLAVRSLYVTLYWAWDRAMVAQHNEEALRDRQAQLARTLKALDEAYRRLEYLNYDLARAREVAEKTRLTKQQFVTDVSHELRTPLNVIVAFSEMMYLSPGSYGGVPLPREYRGDVREIYRSSKYLLHLIDDVLDMSQIEAGRMRIDLEPVRLQDVVIEALDMIRPLVREKEVALRTELPANLPPVLVDRARVQQVLLNLLNNARRFTERGSITVRATHEAERVRVTVADTGMGIPPGEHDKVFEEFRQLDGPATQRRNGSGLGLTISKRFVEMHGGRIWAESDGVPGQGSRFHFTLPVAGVESVQLSTLHGTPMFLRPPTGRGRTLLLLDGDATVVQMLEQGLEEYQVVPVADVSEVPRLIHELHARAVVLNLAQGGYAWRQMRELRRRLTDSSLPIILCPLVGEHQLGHSLGVMGYLVKPVTREALTALLDRLGRSTHRILVVDDDPRMVRILSRLLQATEREVELIRAYNGQEGLCEMRRQRPDLVLLDLIMPEMDGYAVLARMREEPELRHVPVVVVTAQARTPEEERRLGGRMLFVSTGAGFTNEEALTYLRSILNAVGVPSTALRAGPSLLRCAGQSA
jgi:signal transduction histidine kinase/CheY-like chemotaxis protein